MVGEIAHWYLWASGTGITYIYDLCYPLWSLILVIMIAIRRNDYCWHSDHWGRGPIWSLVILCWKWWAGNVVWWCVCIIVEWCMMGERTQFPMISRSTLLNAIDSELDNLEKRKGFYKWKGNQILPQRFTRVESFWPSLYLKKKVYRPKTLFELVNKLTSAKGISRLFWNLCRFGPRLGSGCHNLVGIRAMFRFRGYLGYGLIRLMLCFTLWLLNRGVRLIGCDWMFCMTNFY